MIALLAIEPFDPTDLAQVSKYAGTILHQAEFLSYYIEDLLDLRQLHDGVFSLTLAPFCVV